MNLESVQVAMDRQGFPMIWIEPIDAYLHWYPVTKIQFEYFLCSTTDSRHDDRWYNEILRLNGRASPTSIHVKNYWRGFMTGVFPSEAQRLARWYGESYELPTLEEWYEAYKYLKELNPLEIGWDAHLNGLSSRCFTLLDKFEKVSAKVTASQGYERTLADQMLMRMGVMEWVALSHGRQSWGGMGQLQPEFHGLLFRPDDGQPTVPRAPESERLHYFGFRLLRRSV